MSLLCLCPMGTLALPETLCCLSFQRQPISCAFHSWLEDESPSPSLHISAWVSTTLSPAPSHRPRLG